jgi:ParB family chromosome partitioning protein
VRTVFPAKRLAEMAGSAKEHGILQPVLAHWENDSIVLDEGELRLRAAELAGLSTVPVLIEERALSVVEVIQRQLVANCQRVNLSPVEKARAIDQLIRESKWSAAEVAMKLGMSPAQVSKCLTLLVASPEIQERVCNGELSASSAYHITRVRDAGDRERLAARAAEGALTRDGIAAEAKALAKAPRPRRQSRQRAQRVVFRLEGGRTVAVSGPQLSLNLVLNWVGELFATLNSANASGLALEDVITPAGK